MSPDPRLSELLAFVQHKDECNKWTYVMGSGTKVGPRRFLSADACTCGLAAVLLGGTPPRPNPCELCQAEGVPSPNTAIICEWHYHRIVQRLHEEETTNESAASGGIASSPMRTVEKFQFWVEHTPDDSLTGDSRVAFDAGVRTLWQLQDYLAGEDYLVAAVEWSLQYHGPAAPVRPVQETP